MGTTFGASLPNPVVLLRHNEGKECAKRGGDFPDLKYAHRFLLLFKLWKS